MELKTKRAGGAHLMALIIHQPIFNPSKSAESTPRQRSRPRSLFFRDKNSPTCSEPTSPKVNCAGRVKERAAMKGPAESKGADKKSTLVRSLTSSLRGSMLVDGAIRCCRSPRDLVTGDSDGEEEGGCDLARWFMTAELAGKEGIERMVEVVGEVSVVAPLNALQLMKQRSASARVACMEGEGEGEVVGDPVHSNHSKNTFDLSLIYWPCHSQKTIPLISHDRGPKKGSKEEKEEEKLEFSCHQTPLRPPLGLLPNHQKEEKEEEKLESLATRLFLDYRRNCTWQPPDVGTPPDCLLTQDFRPAAD
ncbi:hypothetical protein M5K25_020551 [Dendrobium thyrsiflorum]|uniref:Uncharacterized protein n=1 Tax=Dendrobium thyrsiflorum TaxID=117978 RepID=A0ABD0UAC1_DENTH